MVETSKYIFLILPASKTFPAKTVTQMQEFFKYRIIVKSCLKTIEWTACFGEREESSIAKRIILESYFSRRKSPFGCKAEFLNADH